MRQREAQELLEKTAERSAGDVLKSTALLGLGGTGVGAGLGLLASEFAGDTYESDPELANIKKRKRRQKALLGGAAIGGAVGGGTALADYMASDVIGNPLTSGKGSWLDPLKSPFNLLTGGGATTATAAYKWPSIVDFFSSDSQRAASAKKLTDNAYQWMTDNAKIDLTDPTKPKRIDTVSMEEALKHVSKPGATRRWVGRAGLLAAILGIGGTLTSLNK